MQIDPSSRATAQELMLDQFIIGVGGGANTSAVRKAAGTVGASPDAYDSSNPRISAEDDQAKFEAAGADKANTYLDASFASAAPDDVQDTIHTLLAEAGAAFGPSDSSSNSSSDPNPFATGAQQFAPSAVFPTNASAPAPIMGHFSRPGTSSSSARSRPGSAVDATAAVLAAAALAVAPGSTVNASTTAAVRNALTSNSSPRKSGGGRRETRREGRGGTGSGEGGRGRGGRGGGRGCTITSGNRNGPDQQQHHQQQQQQQQQQQRRKAFAAAGTSSESLKQANVDRNSNRKGVKNDDGNI